MLKILRRGQRWMMWIVIFLVGGAFVFFLGVGGGFQGSGPQNVAVQVDDRRYDGRDFARVRDALIARYRQILGDSLDIEVLGDRIDQEAAESLVQRAILAGEARRLGLAVSDVEVRGYLRAIPGTVADDGRIDEPTVRAYAEREYGSVRRFQEWLREELLAQKLSRLLRGSVSVSDAEVRDALRYRQEEVLIAYLAIDPADLAKAIEVTDEDVEAHLAEHEEAVRALYEEHSDTYDLDEQVRARHILIRLQSEAGVEPEEVDARARARAEEAIERIRGGEAFEDVASELSEDPGSSTRGGDLGFFPRGRMVKPFEDAAFALEPGTLSEPVKSVHGWHVIRVEERRDAEVIPFEEARSALARERIAEERAAAEADALVAKVLEGIANGRTLVEAARERDLVLERPDPIRRRVDGVIPGLGVDPAALTAIFALTDDDPTLDRVFEIAGRRVLFERLGGSTPSDSEMAAQLETVRDQLLLERQSSFERSWIEARRQTLRNSGNLTIDLRPVRS